MIYAATHKEIISRPEDEYSSCLAGFANRDTRSTTLGPPEIGFALVWVKCNHVDILMLSVDSLYVSSELYNEICMIVNQKYHIAPDAIIFSATHTHSSPNVSWPEFGALDNNFRTRIIDSIDSALYSMSKSFESISLSTFLMPVPSGLIIGRRKKGRDIKSLFFKNKILMLPNKGQEIDKEIRVIELNFKDRKLYLLNMSCHPVFSASSQISSDFPGEIINQLQSSLNCEFIFFQGWCGDIRPNSTSNFKRAPNLILKLKSFFNGDIFVPSTKQFFNDFCKKITYAVSINLKNNLSPETDNNCYAYSGSFELQSHTRKTHKKLPFSIIKLNNILLISIAAEVSSKYYVSLIEELPDLMIVPIGYSNGMIGYLPYPDQVAEGGYEVESYGNYGWDSHISEQSLTGFYDNLRSEIKRAMELH